MATKCILLAMLVFSLSACSSNAKEGNKRVTLIFPENFRGDVYLVAGGSTDLKVDKEIEIPVTGVVYLANFKEVELLPRNAFSAKTRSGKVINSSLEVDSVGPALLWPVGRQEGKIIYFVLGSLDDKIRLSTNKERRWPEIIENLKRR